MNRNLLYGPELIAKIFKVIMCGEKFQEVYFSRQRKEKPYALISIMSTGKILCQ